MRSPSQPTSWQFSLDGGIAYPKDRDEHPDSYDIPPGSITLYPVRKGSHMLYLSYQVKGETVSYWLSSRAGGAHKSAQLNTEDVDAALISGLTAHLPGRINAVTIFNRLMAIPDHLHLRAIDYIATQKINGVYDSSSELKTALLSMLKTLGPATHRSIAVAQMTRELRNTPVARHGSISADYRKRFPEPWVEEAKKKALAQPRPKPAAPTIETEFSYGFD